MDPVTRTMPRDARIQGSGLEDASSKQVETIGATRATDDHGREYSHAARSQLGSGREWRRHLLGSSSSPPRRVLPSQER